MIETTLRRLDNQNLVCPISIKQSNLSTSKSFRKSVNFSQVSTDEIQAKKSCLSIEESLKNVNKTLKEREDITIRKMKNPMLDKEDSNKLERYFLKEKFPEREQIEKIAFKLYLSYRRVEIWFGNRIRYTKNNYL